MITPAYVRGFSAYNSGDEPCAFTRAAGRLWDRRSAS